MNDANPVPAIQLTDKETLCLLMFKNVIFNSDHLKDKTCGEINNTLVFLFTKEVVDKVLDLNSKAGKMEVQLVLHRFT